MSLRQQNKARAKARILTAAQELIAALGLAGATTREIAKRAGISYQTLYNYFPTKGHIVQEMLAADITAWSQDIDMVIKRYEGNLLDSLGAVNQLTLQRFIDKEDMWREVMPMMFDQKLVQQHFTPASQVAHERYYALLAMAQGTGELQANVDLHLLAHIVFSLTDYAGLVYFTFASQDTEVFLENLHAQLQLVLTPYLTDAQDFRTAGSDEYHPLKH